MMAKNKQSAVHVGKKTISHEHPVFVVAEVGINHNGDIELAKKLIDAAIEAGCDAVKFQKRTVPVVYSSEELNRPRAVDKKILQKALERGVLSSEAEERLNLSDFENATNGDLKWALELTKAEYEAIDRYAKAKDIIWFASCWDEQAVDFIEEFNPPAHKIASASITDHGLLRRMRETGRPLILSTGMSDLNMVTSALEVIGTKDLVLLHTVSTYPADERELNLRAIQTLRETFQVPTGYSGHESSLSPSFAAAVMGACLIERHITTDRAMWGSDQAASLETRGFKSLVEMIRKWEKACGTGEKKILPSEEPVMKKLRRK